MTSSPDTHPAAAPLILVVDDSETMRQCIILMLESILTCPRVLQAGDGAEAWGRMQEQRPDLLVTDLVMPGMDGYELLAQLRRQAAWADLPVLVLSGDGLDDWSILSNQDPHLRSLNKPFHLQELSAKVLELLPPKPLRRA